MAEAELPGVTPLPSNGAAATGKGRNQKPSTVASIGAKVSTDGVEKLNSKFKDLLTTLRSVRGELGAIQNGGQPDPSQSANNNKLSGLINGFKNIGQGGGAAGPGRPAGAGANTNGGRLGGMFDNFNPMGAASIGIMGMGAVNSRFNRNMAQSAGISATDTVMASRYNFDYSNAETNRFKFSGSFGGSREEQQRASQMGYGYGMLPHANNRFMTSMGMGVQAYGGTQTIGQVAESAGDFMDPLVSRRALAFGITPGRMGGEVANPLQTAQGYLNHFQSRYGKMTEADLADLSSPGSRIRYSMSRHYRLGDSAIDQIQMAGQQQMTFNERGGVGMLDYNSSEDLNSIGLGKDKLGLQTQLFTTAVGKRESDFFKNQEGAMTSRIDQEIKITEILGETEQKFGALIGIMYQFENVMKIATATMGAAGIMGIGRGGTSPAAIAPATYTIPGAQPGGPLGGHVAAGRPIMPTRGGAPAGGAAAGGRGNGGFASPGMMARGATSMAGGMMVAGSAASSYAGGATGSNFAIGSSVAMGAMGGAMLMAAGPPGARVAGAVVGGGIALAAGLYGKAKENSNNKQMAGVEEAQTMTEAELLESINDYVKKDGDNRADIGGSGAGNKQIGRHDVFAQRRGHLFAQVLTEAQDVLFPDGLDDAPGANEYSKLIRDLTNGRTSSDSAWLGMRDKTKELGLLEKLQNSTEGQEIYRKYFGDVTSPWDYHNVVTTSEMKDLTMSDSQFHEVTANPSMITEGANGDPSSAGTGAGGGTLTGVKANQSVGAHGIGPGNPSWDKLDGRMKERITALIKASNGKVWINEGWRDPNSQHSHDEFVRRHRPDPNGEREYKGQRWTLRPGFAPLAPPGRSNHNIGLAADMDGDMTWLMQNAARFNLKHFKNVGNEPWHIQLAELDNGFLGEGAYQGTGESMPEGEQQDPGGGGAAGGSGFAAAASGVNYDIASRLTAGFGGASSFQGTAAETTAGAMGADVEPYEGGTMTAEQVAVVAYGAGFRGQDLVNMVAIAKRESGYKPGALNPDKSTGDMSYGLWQLNTLNGPGGMMGDLMNELLGKPRGNMNFDELYDPQINANMAYQFYLRNGKTLAPWGAYKGESNTYGTDTEAAAVAVSNAGYPTGDPFAQAPPTAPSASGGSMLTVQMGGVTINSQGDAAYDADAFIRAVTPKLEQAAGMAAKRTSG